MMLVRICLIVGILASLAAAAVSHFQVDTKIKELNTNLTETKDSLDKSQTAERKAKNEATATKATLEKTNKELLAKTKTLQDTTAELGVQRKRADSKSAELVQVTEERNNAQRELAAWNAYNIRVDQVSNLVVNLKNASAEIDAIKEENIVLLRNNSQIQAKLDLYEKPDQKVVMREGLKGKVIAVDPKWDFVVLNIGSDQGALERGELLVDRNGKLVAKLRLTSVERDRSIANILPEYHQAGTEVMEGDQVIY